MSKNTKIVIYTAIFGDFDELKEQPQQNIPVDFVCFTDKKRESKTWQVVMPETPDYLKEMSPRMQAKYFKILPQEVPELSKYDLSIWIDGQALITSPDFATTLIEQISEFGMLVFKHPLRDCIYDEAVASLPLEKYRDQEIQAQVDYYRGAGLPEHYGLAACGLIARKHSDFDLMVFSDRWWMENVSWSYQDQLSFPYTAWRTKYPFKFLQMDLWNNEIIDFKFTHNSEK